MNNLTNKQIFYYIENQNHQPVLTFFSSFSKRFYFFCKKRDQLKLLSEHQIQAAFDDACILLYEKIETKQLTYKQMSASAETLIFAIAKNMLSEQGREQLKYNSLHSSLDNNYEEVSRREEDNDDYWLTELEMQQLDEGLSSLSSKSYALIVEGFMESKSYSQIAKEQNYSSANAVGVAIHRTLKVLKECVIGIRKRDGNY
ncbi:sigma-70 family RNA polymerase sigma factor [Bernardetia sp. ABR2-2B]|uniref:RNA polymerase sigma factor n=1 Tax=Bernardetia sp. ABR2-2B TaxID=3127472 RepID=UPI0030CF1F0C